MRIKPKKLAEVVKLAEKDDDILAVVLFGSMARDEPARDIDVCLVLFPDRASQSFEKQVKYSIHEALDIRVFQDLPLYTRIRILREGKVLTCKDEDLFYDIAAATVREFEYFKPRYEEYLEGIMNG